MKASTYIAKYNEANFGKPIKSQIVGGTHITLELITKNKNRFYMTRWPKGLPRHEDPPNALRFPHGLIIFGEEPRQCAVRLVRDQLGMVVDSCRIIYMDSYVDDADHWHIELGFVVEVSGKPKVPKEADKIIDFTITDMPDMSFYSHDEFKELVNEFMPELLNNSYKNA